MMEKLKFQLNKRIEHLEKFPLIILRLMIFHV